MSLYNINNKLQISTGHKNCWKNFDMFINSKEHKKLYNLLINEISSYIDDNYNKIEEIDSSKLGACIIKKIKNSDLELYKQLYGTLHGGIFGMTLYNFLAKDERKWYFLTESIDKFDEKSGSKYFKKRIQFRHR
jgi:hypothetical protein